MKSAFPLLLAAMSGACYHYAPISADAVQPGTGVRARVSAGHAEQIAPLLGRTDARLLVGRYLATNADTLIVEVPTTERVAQSAGPLTLNQRVGIPRSALLDLETRVLDRRRTTLVAGVAAFVVASFLVKTFIIDPGRERGPTDPGGTELLPRR